METGHRYAQNEKPDGRRRFRAHFLLAAFLVGSALALLFGSPLSRVTEIRVEGTHHLSPEEVEQASGVFPGMWWFRVKPDEVAAKLKESFPLVADVQVRIGWTGKVTISVREKEVVAIFPAGGVWYRLLEDGTAFDVVRPGETIQIPLVTVDRPVQVTMGKPVPVEAVGQACRQLSQIPADLRAQFSEVHTGDSDIWTVYSVDHYEVHVPVRDFITRIQWFPKIREQVKDRGPGEIWLTDPFRYSPFQGRKGSA